jgi:hypothetical protein
MCGIVANCLSPSDLVDRLRRTGREGTSFRTCAYLIELERVLVGIKCGYSTHSYPFSLSEILKTVKASTESFLNDEASSKV